MKILTLVKHVLILLAFLSTTGSRVELITDAAEESTTALLLFTLALVLVLVLGALALAGSALEEVHG